MLTRPSIKTESRIPFLPLSGYYFFYFAAVGIILPFLGLYLQSLNFSAIEIAQLLAVLSFVRIISPPIWALLADRKRNFLFYVQVASWLSAVLLLGLWFLTDYWALFWLIAWMGFFWHAALPPMESLTMSHIESQPQAYSRIRLWGSIGFVVAVVVTGWAIERFDQLAFLVLASVFFIATALVAHGNKEAPVKSQVAFSWSGLLDLLRRPIVWWVLAIGLLLQMAHGIYYSFYSILLHDVGYSNQAIGLLWSLGVIAEIGLFWYFARFSEKLSASGWFLVASGVSVVRWLLIGLYPDSLALMILAQLMHAITFAAFHSVIIRWLHEAFVGYQAQAQALYASIGYGVGGVVGTLLAGYAWTYGGGSWTFGLAALVSLIACALVIKVKQAN